MSHPISGREQPVRYRDGFFEMRCTMCADWWPLDQEFWQPKSGLQRCRACWREYHRIHEAHRRSDEATRQVIRYKSRLRYAENRGLHRAYGFAWRAAHKEHIAAYNRSYRERKRAA